MAYCESIWSHDDLDQVTRGDWDNTSQTLLQASPALITILQAINFIQDRKSLLLLKIHLLLDFSWSELRIEICFLHLFTGHGWFIANLFTIAQAPTLFPAPFDSIMHDLACGALRVNQKILHGEVTQALWMR
jgi:hypothetical protein